MMNKTKPQPASWGDGTGSMENSPSKSDCTQEETTCQSVEEVVSVLKFDGRPIGVVKGSVFLKQAHSKRQMLRHPAGWALDICAIDQLMRLGVNFIRIEDADADCAYVCSLPTFLKGAEYISRGYGPQLMLPVSKWAILNHNQ